MKILFLHKIKSHLNNLIKCHCLKYRYRMLLCTWLTLYDVLSVFCLRFPHQFRPILHLLDPGANRMRIQCGAGCETLFFFTTEAFRSDYQIPVPVITLPSSVLTKCTVYWSLVLCACVILRGQCHKIFDLWFFSSNNPTWAPD
jgi:hypothetical protein